MKQVSEKDEVLEKQEALLVHEKESNEELKGLLKLEKEKNEKVDLELQHARRM